MTQAMTPVVSIVIPTFNRAARLLGALECLARQTLPSASFEVVVVSDGSHDDTVVQARGLAASLPYRLEVIDAAHGGPAAARNLGWRAARAPIVAFTDDDVLPAPGWLAAGSARLAREPKLAGVEGRTLAEVGPASLFRINIENRSGGIYPTCNMFYRRSALAAVGGFDARFRRYSDDSDLAFRVLDAVGPIAFEPAAEVLHRSHLPSLRVPLGFSSQLPDNLLLEAKHPRRPRLRRPIYRSDLIKIGLALAALGLALAGRPWPAVGAALLFLVLVLRAMLGEVVVARVLRPDRLVALVAIYAWLPFSNLRWLLVGWRRVRAAGLAMWRRGEATRPGRAPVGRTARLR